MKPQFLKDRYDFELQRKEQLTSALTLPVGVLSGLGGLMAAMARSFTAKTLWIALPFFAAFALDVVAFFTCLVYLARAYHRQKYMYLPTLKELQDWEDAFVGLFSYDAAMGKADAAFEKHIGERIIEAADRNTANNDYRSGLLHRARLALFAVLICTTAAGVAYVLNQMVK
jgi:hypothetical protein